MPKERNYNPVQAQRKAEKAKAIKKGKADVAAARNERLAKKNPDRIRKQIQDLRAIAEGGGKLTRHEEQVLDGLEKELKAVTKARETRGDRAPTFIHGSGGSMRHDSSPHDGFGKKRRRDRDGDDDDDSSNGSDVPDDVRRIPMPRDTPPPIPKAILDEWYAKQRARRNANSNTEPLGEARSWAAAKGDAALSSAAATSYATTKPVEVKTVYEGKPVLRNLQKEAVTAFMPAVVQRKLDKSRGMGGLLEPEEADRLEKEGYLKSTVSARSSGRGGGGNDSVFTVPRDDIPHTAQPHSADVLAANFSGPRHVTIEEVDGDHEDE